nr:MAG TPA: hypothetical protein [Bacteriophage sp.]
MYCAKIAIYFSVLFTSFLCSKNAELSFNLLCNSGNIVKEF